MNSNGYAQHMENKVLKWIISGSEAADLFWLVPVIDKNGEMQSCNVLPMR